MLIPTADIVNVLLEYKEVTGTHRSKNNFHRIENMIPCSPFASILVFNPRPNKPLHPSVAIMARAASKYPILVSFTCLYVFTTRNELEMVSDTTDALNPMKAERNSRSPSECATGRFVSR